MGAAEYVSGILNGRVMPALLIFCGIVLAVRIKLFRVVSPRGFLRDLKSSSKGGKNTPVRSLCTALAGTLGVGNIAGVATAITAGGPGAVMWMWIGAAVSMSVKYGEVVLAVKYRRREKERYFGGSMYTMRDGLSGRVGRRPAAVLGAVFAALCILNSLVMGNLIQSNAASAVFGGPAVPKAVCTMMALGVLLTAFTGKDRTAAVTVALIPALSAVYVGLSLFVIITNYSHLPQVFKMICSGAFSFRAAAGGAAGHTVREALRFGVTRGIFSNEAGCGTSPTAHASADVRSPHKQGCFGIFEVIADTLILCSMTAFVILIAGIRYPGAAGLDGVPLTLASFGAAAGRNANYAIGVSVILFAYATVIAQVFYGGVALGYLTRSRAAKRVYGVSAAAVTFFGWAAPPGIMWIAADLIVGVMTVLNVSVLLVMRREIGDEAKRGLGER